jgi:hypothetical protein
MGSWCRPRTLRITAGGFTIEGHDILDFVPDLNAPSHIDETP